MLSALEGSLAESLSSFEYTQMNNWQERERADSTTAQQMLESTSTVASTENSHLVTSKQQTRQIKNPNPKYPLPSVSTVIGCL